MSDHLRFRRNANWYAAGVSGDAYETIPQGIFVALLSDIREELRTLNRVFACSNTQAIPRILRRISANTAKPKKKKKKTPVKGLR